jgi:hypothetical protein
MKWADTILFDRPLRDVTLLANSPAQEWQTFLHDREAAAFESGRRAGETALNEQLIQWNCNTVFLAPCKQRCRKSCARPRRR